MIISYYEDNNKKTLEIFWLIFATVSVLLISIMIGDSVVGIISALSGIICVVQTARGKLSAYFFGVINCILYSIIS